MARSTIASRQIASLVYPNNEITVPSRNGYYLIYGGRITTTAYVLLLVGVYQGALNKDSICEIHKDTNMSYQRNGNTISILYGGGTTGVWCYVLQ